jgi:hypothetical protein
MSLEEIKEQIAALPPTKQDEVMAFLFHLRHGQESSFHGDVSRRLDDKDAAHWLTPDDFERELDRKQG